jgi:poly(rC)-binding protein 2/3/4
MFILREIFMQITGGYKCVENALRKITSRIRDNPLPNEVFAEARKKQSFQVNKDTVKSKFVTRKKTYVPFGKFPPQVCSLLCVYHLLISIKSYFFLGF